MYYEEKVSLGGVLHYRTTPDGEWLPSKAPHAYAVRELMALTDEQRLSVFRHFCTHCGRTDPRCQCWNDE